MTMGRSPQQTPLPEHSTTEFCQQHLPSTSIYTLLHRDGHRLFPDEMFADLFSAIGRNSEPPRWVATVMVLQRLEGLSDREAVERLLFDLRWKYACGGLDFDYESLAHTVLVEMRERLRKSGNPDRIFDVAIKVAKDAGLVGRKRVLDSTALYDAVATQDTVTLIRSAIRGLLKVADAELEKELRTALQRDDDYRKPGKPVCDWEDEEAREQLVDALAKDALALLLVLEDRTCSREVTEAAQLLATVVGQDLKQTSEGKFRIARRVAPDRVISTVDPEARHGHKTAARGFDGYKGHISVDPDSELIMAVEVTPGNAADGSVAKELLQEVLQSPIVEVQPAGSELSAVEQNEPSMPEQGEASTPSSPSELSSMAPNTSSSPIGHSELAPSEAPVEVYGDSSYGTADLVEHVEQAGGEANLKVQHPSALAGKFSKENFVIDEEVGTVKCPQGKLVQIRRQKDGSGLASFGEQCKGCPLKERCTDSNEGRTIRIHPREGTLSRYRRRQKQEDWKRKYRSTRPKVERKIADLTRRRHGGRRMRVRGRERVRQDFALGAAAVNFKRLAKLGARHSGKKWVVGE
jgi:transposase